MKTKSIYLIAALALMALACGRPGDGKACYTANRPPLAAVPFLELPIGAIHPEGWLQEQLCRMRGGLTSNMDSVYAAVDGPDNAWLGGSGDCWERGPYWIDGLLPLAYILDDDNLKAKALKWVEWTLASQDEDGYFGPAVDNTPREGLQTDNSHDWWPRMVMLKVLKQYYQASSDGRVIDFMLKYFRYQLANLGGTPLGHWTFWGEQRGGDNLDIVYWLYNLTGEKFLLELGELIHSQTYDWAGAFAGGETIRTFMGHHCVNLAHGFKAPVVYWQQAKEDALLAAPKKAAAVIRNSVGLPTGLWAGDEMLHAGDPTAGSELCTAVEMMYSLELMSRISGDVFWMDYLERVAYNALPAQTDSLFTSKQYYQQTNQIEASRRDRQFTTSHKGTDTVFGTLNGYPCCLSNMHQGWPKFVQNLWYATPDGGAAALVYAPCRVDMLVADGQRISISEETRYPFGETVAFRVTEACDGGAFFGLSLRIPAWCTAASLAIGGEPIDLECAPGTIVTVSRQWRQGDLLQLALPQEVVMTNWYNGAACFERGPLVYALPLGETWTRKSFSPAEEAEFGEFYWEVTTSDRWNYAVKNWDERRVAAREDFPLWPWTAASAPVSIFTKGYILPLWHEYDGNCGPVMYGIQWAPTMGEGEEIELVPYGCTKLRIAEFPVR